MEINNTSKETEEATIREPWYKPLTQVTPLTKYLAGILFIALPFLGFWLGLQVNTENITRQTSTPFETSSGANVLSERIDVDDSWKIFSNEKVGFSLELPLDWSIEPYQDNIWYIKGPMFSIGGCGELGMLCEPQFTIGWREGDNSERLPIERWFSEKSGMLGNVVSDFELTEIGGLPAIKTIGADGIGSPVFYFVGLDDNILSFSYSERALDVNEQPVDVYERMLNSVTFNNIDDIKQKNDYYLNIRGELFRNLIDGKNMVLVSEKDMKAGIAYDFGGNEYPFQKGKVLDFWPSPDGKYVAYTIQEGLTSCCTAPPTAPSMRLVVTDSDGKNHVIIDQTPHRGSKILFSGWKYDSTTFVFYDQLEDEVTQGSLFYEGEVGTPVIEVFKGFSYTAGELERNSTNAFLAEPYFSPTEDVMVYRKGGIGGNEIVISHLDGSDGKVIMNVTDVRTDISWKEDGSAFTVITGEGRVQNFEVQKLFEL